MTPEQKERAFFFEGKPVGYFSQSALPSEPGRYKYVPFRGLGHYNLGQALISKGPQRCELFSAEKPRQFTVQSIPEYGVLEITLFD